MGPAFQGNSDVLLRMTEAQAAWNQTMNGLTLSARYEGAEADADALLDEVAADLSRRGRGQRAALLRGAGPEQREAAAEWFEAARAAEQVRHEGPAARPGRGSGARAVQRLRTANQALDDVVQAQQRPGAHPRLLWTVVGVVLVGALLAMLVVLLGGRMINASLIAPLTASGSSPGSGDDTVQADERHGAAEVRALAADYNELTRAKRQLQDEQAQTLLVHRLALEVARRARGMHDIGRRCTWCASRRGSVGGRPALHGGRPRRRRGQRAVPPLRPAAPAAAPAVPRARWSRSTTSCAGRRPSSGCPTCSTWRCATTRGSRHTTARPERGRCSWCPSGWASGVWACWR